ncbi:MAG: hypothetical protein R2821_08805 [Flavobacteriaceae bacterium]
MGLQQVWDRYGISDAMIFAMVFPKHDRAYLLAPVVRQQLKRYVDAIKLKRNALS